MPMKNTITRVFLKSPSFLLLASFFSLKTKHNHLFPLCQVILLGTLVCKWIEKIKIIIDGNVSRAQREEGSEKILIVLERSSMLTVRRRVCKSIGVRQKEEQFTVLSKDPYL